VPSKRALPIHDARHVRMAWSQVERTKDLTDDEKTEARRRIKEKADSLGIDTAGWEMKAEADTGLYVSRPLTPESAAALLEWARTQGFAKHMPAGELHVTLVSSEVSAELEPHAHEVRIEGGDRSVTAIGHGGAIALRFESEELRARWQELLDAGAVSDFEDYLPHVTITWGNDPVEMDNVTPFLGDLVFGPERHEPLNRNAVEEKGLAMQAGASIRLDGESLEAMALQMPDVKGHPNRMPFSGVLTRLDTPSDRPPGGSKGKKVILTKSAAERALPSLLGMAVDFTENLDGHDAKRKIGVITGARIEGDAVKVDGILYARDFPQETSRIQTNKKDLGFSWELADIYVERLDADPLVITDAYFTGAAILRKDKAAYQSTSLAASAGDLEMTKEEIAAAVGEAVGAAMKPLNDAVTALQAGQEATAKAVAHMQASAATADEEKAKAAAEAKDARLSRARNPGEGPASRGSEVQGRARAQDLWPRPSRRCSPRRT
jgi:hypothetical protein